MKRLFFAVGVVSFAFAASGSAQADYSVVKFKDSGTCRAWYDPSTKPSGSYQVLWAKTPSWDVAQTKGDYAMSHKWCKTWWK